MNTRMAANLELVNLLTELIEKNHDQRFSQILQNYGFIKPNRPAKEDNMIDWQNEFYMESDRLLKRVKQRIEDMKNDI